MAQPQSNVPGVRYAVEPVDHDPFEMTAGELAGASDPADPTGGATLTIAPEDHLTEDDKIRAHLAWLKAQDTSTGDVRGTLSRLKHSLDPRVSDDAWVKEARDAQIRSGAWSGVGSPNLSPEVLAGVAGRFVADQLGATKSAYDLGAASQDAFARTGHFSSPEIAGGSAGLALGLAAGGMGSAEPGAAGIFGGRLSQGADLGGLAQAQVRLDMGARPREVWRDFGWAKDVDGKWKYEIPDAGASLASVKTDLAPGSTYRLGDVMDHPELYKSYPDMADMRLGFDVNGPLYGRFDADHPHGPTIQLNPQLDPDTQLSVALHELQHGVQAKEGFAKGDSVKNMDPETERLAEQSAAEHAALMQKGMAQGNALHPDDLARYNQLGDFLSQVRDFRSAAYKDYSRSAGEVEARNVQSRLGVTPEESRALHPDDTADVAPGDRRVRFEVEGGPTAQSQSAEAPLGPAGKAYMLEQGEKHYASSDEFFHQHPYLGTHMLDLADGAKPYGQLKPESQSILDYHLGVAKALDAGENPAMVQKPFGVDTSKGTAEPAAPQTFGWSPEAAKLLDDKIDFHASKGDNWYEGQLMDMLMAGPNAKPKDSVADWHEAAMKLQGPPGWHPEALAHLENIKSESSYPDSKKELQSIINAGPLSVVDHNNPFSIYHNEAKTIHDKASAPPEWSPEAFKHLQNQANKVYDLNPSLANALSKLAAEGPGATLDPKQPHYWKLLDHLENAKDIHEGKPTSTGAALEDLGNYGGNEGSLHGVPFEQALKPIDWQNYRPLDTPSVRPKTMEEKAQAARSLGFNPDVPLFKGMSWHEKQDQDTGLGSGLGPLGGFADPGAKPYERAIFATHEPRIANQYSGSSGYNMLPMYGRAENAHEVHWPDIAADKGYDGGVMQKLINHARERGIDALVIHGISDMGGDQTQYAFMHNDRFRAHHAAFDPAKLNSPDLLHTRGLGVRFQTDDDRPTKSVVLHLGDPR